MSRLCCLRSARVFFTFTFVVTTLRQGIIIIDTGRGGLRSLPIPAAGRTFDGESIPALSAARLFLSSYMQN